MEAFDNIRPYSDEEVRPTLNRLLRDRNLLDVLAKHRFPKLACQFPKITQWMTKLSLKYKTRHINNIRTFQDLIEPYLTRIIKTTTANVTVSGLEELQKDKAYLFLSNHRDIVLDPALVNYALYQNDMETCQIAIGDNLIYRPFVSDLMRLNKSFIVKRSLTSRRDKLAAFRTLSAYIHYCIDSGQPVWIAQSEGRAKDGNDHTDPAIIKMFNFSKKDKSTDFSENICSLNIVPVSISYEYDPCDINKAKELFEKTELGHYQKAHDEDLRSIVKGINGYKGHIHVAFGRPLAGHYKDADEVARKVDYQIHHNYHLHPSNLIALSSINEHQLNLLNNIPNQFSELDIEQKKVEFSQRLNTCPESYRFLFLSMYAQPAINRLYDNHSSLKKQN